MKTNILIVLMCLFCLASFAQSAKRTPRKPLRRTRTQIQNARRRNNNKGGAGNAVNSSAGPGKPTGIPNDSTPKKPIPARVYFPRPVDGYLKKTNIIDAKVTPYANLREPDVAFVKRIWRIIDVREKMNQYLASPKARLIDVLMEAIKKGELTAYNPDANPDTSIYSTKANIDPTVDPDGDQFSKNLTVDEVYQRLGKMNDSVTIVKRDPNTGEKLPESYKVAVKIDPDSIVKFELKEDWIFDKQRSVFEPRIVGIAPMIRVALGKNLKSVDFYPAFWIYFKDARPILATHEVASRKSDATGLSFDDVFLKRLFASYIIKESNDKDETIAKNFTGIDRLYEGERIKKELMDWELNLWQY